VNRKAVAAYSFILVPMVACLIAGAEFWPFTYFPMYSQRAKEFDWPHVQIRGAGSQNWNDLNEESCYAPFGYVRFHFSTQRFFRLQRHRSLEALQKSLALAVSKNCGDRNWEALRIEFRKHRVGDTSKSVFISAEVPIVH